ncbi:hypothetical protein B0I35DRAFT_250971 [Stachybotrys elegans]|uniref:Uncharacterized protein n=1 Tax=Stachybotrys elegans TaxID=80388 RepID=A0A8K0WSQ2_9HYPO|nr:hypothetical protein B0I35DRAFT_250971 [Stachybotrys elegans]
MHALPPLCGKSRVFPLPSVSPTRLTHPLDFSPVRFLPNYGVVALVVSGRSFLVSARLTTSRNTRTVKATATRKQKVVDNLLPYRPDILFHLQALQASQHSWYVFFLPLSLLVYISDYRSISTPLLLILNRYWPAPPLSSSQRSLDKDARQSQEKHNLSLCQPVIQPASPSGSAQLASLSTLSIRESRSGTASYLTVHLLWPAALYGPPACLLACPLGRCSATVTRRPSQQPSS